MFIIMIKLSSLIMYVFGYKQNNGKKSTGSEKFCYLFNSFWGNNAVVLLCYTDVSICNATLYVNVSRMKMNAGRSHVYEYVRGKFKL